MTGNETAPLVTGPSQVRSLVKGGLDVSSVGEMAVLLAGRGWAVFPCRPGDKRPAVDRWEQRACADPARVARYWPSPRHNIGVACGPSGLVVVDLDTAAHGGELPDAWRMPGVNEGADVLVVLAERHGQVGWPSTYTVRTPSGGTHLYFLATKGRQIRNSAGKVGPMVDVRAAGGYVVGAGSVTSAGVYELLDDCDPAALPGWLADLADPPQGDPPPPAPAGVGSAPRGRLRGLVETVLTARQGQRNNVLHWAACRAAEMAAAGEVDEHAACEALVMAAAEIGLDEAEARRTIASALRRGAA